MEEAQPEYLVGLKVRPPQLAAERRYVVAELAYVQRQLDALDGKWRPSLPKLGVFKAEDWQRYARELEHYERALDKHESEVADGMVPFQIFVINDTGRDDAQIKTRVTVENGEIHTKKEPPQRPERLDNGGAKVAAGPVVSGMPPRPAVTVYHGFTRRGVRIGKHELAAEFSRLADGDGAELVRQLLYLQVSDQTRLHFELSSREVAHLAGEVEIFDEEPGVE
jgi:hypothetical protein